MSDRTYIAIDLKSFYASVECADRKLAKYFLATTALWRFAEMFTPI